VRLLGSQVCVETGQKDMPSGVGRWRDPAHPQLSRWDYILCGVLGAHRFATGGIEPYLDLLGHNRRPAVPRIQNPDTLKCNLYQFHTQEILSHNSKRL
jgi:hypothetical protein